VFEVWKEDGLLKVGAPRVQLEAEEKKVEMPKENIVRSVEYSIDGKLAEY